MAGSKCRHLNKGGLGLHTKASYQGRASPLPDLQHFQKADELDLRKRARIVAQVVVGTDPVLMLTGPIAATRKVLAKAKLRIEDIDAVEINEAFAGVVLAWAQELQPHDDQTAISQFPGRPSRFRLGFSRASCSACVPPGRCCAECTHHAAAATWRELKPW